MIHNFNAGPAVLPATVLREAKEELLELGGTGISILETSHRAPAFEAVLAEAKASFARLYALPEEWDVLFLQGGAHLQFAMIPLNLGPNGAFVTTGHWGERALAEARIVGPATELWSDATGGFRRCPSDGDALPVPDGAPYVHVTTNNTIYGTQWRGHVATAKPVVADMSSDVLSRPIDPSHLGILYAGAQKNAGAAGVTIVAGRKALLRSFAGRSDVPEILRWATHAKAGSLHHTPNTFGIWLCGKVFRWLEDQGGLPVLAKRNDEKAALVYDAIDARPELFRGHAERAFRSKMNVTFTLPDEALTQRFLSFTEARGMIGLKGHRSVGGLRASLYNALPVESAAALADAIRAFDPALGVASRPAR